MKKGNLFVFFDVFGERTSFPSLFSFSLSGKNTNFAVVFR